MLNAQSSSVRARSSGTTREEGEPPTSSGTENGPLNGSSQVPEKSAAVAVLAVPSAEVLARPARRRFSKEYKLRILQEVERCPGGQIGALLRREGIYSSHLDR